MAEPEPSSSRPVPPAPLRLHASSDTATLAGVRRAVEAYATAIGFDEATAAQIGLVVNEAMANIIRHAYCCQPGRPIDLEAEPLIEAHRGIALRLRMRDWGNGVNPECLPVRGYQPGEPGGLGLVCLKAMMDSVQYTPQPDGMLLTMTKRQAATAETAPGSPGASHASGDPARRDP